MNNFNDIGIESKLDTKRIAHLFKIGLFAAFLVLEGDMLLGWCVPDENLSGMKAYFSKYLTVSDTRIFWSAVLGMVGIPLECLCYFGVYRLIAPNSEKYAHKLRSGILGMLTFGGFVHVMCCAVPYYFKHIYELSPDTAVAQALSLAKYFLLPPTIVFFGFTIYMVTVQIKVFAKGLTPYPSWCLIFSFPFGFLVIILMKLIGEYGLTNALATGWISIANLWIFGGLLIVGRKRGII